MTLEEQEPFANLQGHEDAFADLAAPNETRPPGAPPTDYPAPFRASELEGKPVPPREWLVEGLIPMATVTMLGGDGGTGKSLLAQMLAAAVATDGAWIGREIRHGSALYVSAEDEAEELHRRLHDIGRATNTRLGDMQRLTLWSLVGYDALMAHVDLGGGLTPSPLFEMVCERAAAMKPALIVFDTLANLFPGNENDRVQANAFIMLLRGLALRTGAAVVLLNHPSLSGLTSGSGSSGSTAWNNSVRSRLYFSRVRSPEGDEPDKDVRMLSTKKANYAGTGDEMLLRWRDGVFVQDVSEGGLDRMAARAKAERVFLKLLRLFETQQRYVNANGGASYAPAVFAAHPESEGLTKRAFAAAMNELFASESIRNVEYGPQSRRSTRLSPVDSSL